MNLELIVKNIEQTVVILSYQGEALVWSKNKLPDNLQVGQTIYFTISDQPEQTGSLSAVELLNNILQV